MKISKMDTVGCCAMSNDSRAHYVAAGLKFDIYDQLTQLAAAPKGNTCDHQDSCIKGIGQV